MRLEQLEYVAAVNQHGSLRRASERLHVSQPALSEAVSKLERELGVQLLDRQRSGARISREGQALLQPMTEVLDAVERLRAAAGDHGVASRRIRLGTVGAATATLVVPAVARLQAAHPGTTVELATLTSAAVDQGLLDGSLDLGLVNVLGNDVPPAGLSSTDLLRGRPVVVMRPDHPWAALTEVSVDQLRTERFVAMRSGYLMHDFVHRLFGSDLPEVVHSTDGAELAKTLVAQGLGVSVLPDFSVADDPLDRAGLIITRALAGVDDVVTLVLRQRRSVSVSRQVAELRAALVHGAGSSTPPHPGPVAPPAPAAPPALVAPPAPVAPVATAV